MTDDTALLRTDETLAGEGPLIDVQGVSKAYNGSPVIRDVSMTVDEGEVVAIIGLSGCGKSTLLKLISGLERPDSGEIALRDPNVAFVFQYSALFDSLSVFENVAFSLLESPDNPKAKRPAMKMRDIRRQAEEKLRLVGLEGIEDKAPNDLSGGMKKRVSFARAIMSNPRIILYDEPTAGLDPVASTMIEDYILKLRDELGAASVVVTHQHSTIHRTADRVNLLHEGRIQWSGSPQELSASDNPYARQFTEAALEGPLTAD